MQRRDFLTIASAGLSSTFLSQQLAVSARAFGGELRPPAPTNHPAQAKQLIFVFLTGGFSHVDTFDPKPKLKQDHGKIVNGESLRDSERIPLLGSPFQFQPHGESGIQISELFPRLAQHSDSLCLFRTMHTDILEHFQAALAMHTGSATVPMPSIGAWLSYGLGSLNPNLPPYFVLCEHLPYGGAQVWDCSFLPPEHQGTRLIPGETGIPNLSAPAQTATIADLEQRLLEDFNELHQRDRDGDPQLRGRIASFHTARGMMRVAPQVLDLSGETRQTLSEYGVQENDRQSFGWQCLLARRLIEQGVRTVELIDTGAGNNWDAHGDMQAHRPKAERVDRPLAALIGDLQRRGMLDDTLVAICTEFGRTPWDKGPGRNHWHRAFTCLMAGGGIRGGTVIGQTDEYGILPVEDPVHVHDYHATMLHLLGIDHTKLTYRYAGRDFRLTDVHGSVIQKALIHPCVTG